MTRTVSGLLLCDVKQGPDLRFRSLHDREHLLSCSFQKIKVTSLVTGQVFAAEEVCVHALGAVNYLQDRVCGAHQVKRFSSSKADREMRLYRIVRNRWCVPDGLLHHSLQHRSKMSDLTPERNCSSSPAHERSFAALCLQKFGCISLLLCSLLGSKFLPPKSNCKGCYRKDCLGPGGPFALCDAKGLRDPAAVIDRVDHATSPVFNAEIVCGGIA